MTRAGRGMAWVAVLVAFLLLSISISARAIGPGDRAPAFELPWLAAEGTARSTEILSEGEVTVLIVWDRGCPHCTEVALASSVLADSVEPLGGRVFGIVMGPDDPEALKDLLWDRGVLVPHLWDGRRTVAGPYGIGLRHLGIFVVDRAGTVRAVFDDQIPDPVGPILPAVRSVLASPPEPVAGRPAPVWAEAWPVLRIDGRTRLLSTAGVRQGDTGFFGETLENGTVFLSRVDLRLGWMIAPGLEFEPWLRVGNESDEVLMEGPEQLSSRHGSASLRGRRGPISGVLGAFPTRVSPLLLQRWDRDDAAPIGGASGCGCGPGASGLHQYSLEVLDPPYTFEGLATAYSHRFFRLRGWVAVPRWEREVRTDAPPQERVKARYRRILHAATIDLGRAGTEDPEFGLPGPVGLRLGMVLVDDDQRTIPKATYLIRPDDREERGWVALGRAGPWIGIGADGEFVEWDLHERGRTVEGTAHRFGIRGKWTVGRTSLWGRIHRIHTEQWFDPLYRALTYEANREGWRVSCGVGILPQAGAPRERLALTLFYRGVQETEPDEAPEYGRMKYRVTSLTLSGRPMRGLLTEVSLIELRHRSPIPGVPEQTTNGASFDLRWEGLPALDPVLHLDWIRSDPTGGDPATIWQTYISVRFLR